MNPELETAVKERVSLGHNKEQIATELRAAGYDDATIEHVYATVTAADATDGMNAVPVPERSATDIFGASWRFMTSRLDLVALAAAPALVSGFLSLSIQFDLFSGVSAAVLLGLGLIVVTLVQFVLQLGFTHAALSAVRNAPVSFGVSWNWALANALAWLWIILISTAVILGASLFLLIPGIVASVYIMFAVYCFVDEGKRGMSALQRSREIITDHAMFLLVKLFAFVLFMFLFGLAFGILMGLISGLGMAVEGLTAATTIGVVLEAVLTGIATILGAFYIAQLYDIIKARPQRPIPPTSWYKVAGIIGAVVFIGIMALAVIGVVAEEVLTNEITSFEEEITETLSPEEQAEFEAFLNEFGTELDLGVELE